MRELEKVLVRIPCHLRSWIRACVINRRETDVDFSQGLGFKLTKKGKRWHWTIHFGGVTEEGEI